MDHKGWIALDIDGTLTEDKYSIPPEVCLFLKSLHEKKWKIVITTGRTASFAMNAIRCLHFPLTFCAQNGSVVVDLPSKEVLHSRYMESSALEALEKVFDDEPTDFLMYSGVEKGDFCYWRSTHFDREQSLYIEDLKNRQVEDWHQVPTFDPHHLPRFPMAKAFGHKDLMQPIEEKLRATGFFQTALIRDPFKADYFLLLITAKGVSKGSTLKFMMDQEASKPYSIAAGDDENDRSMFEVVDFKIVMQTAPEQLLKLADYVAKPAADLGIIQALQYATTRRT